MICILYRFPVLLATPFLPSCYPLAFSMLTMNAFDSGIDVLGSPINGVSKLALSPPLPSTGYCHPKCQGSPTWCIVVFITLNGLNRSVTTAIAQRDPREEETVTFSPFFIPLSAASSLLSSTNICGCISSNHGAWRVMTPVCQCSVTL